MQISQLELFSLLIHSSVGGMFLAFVYELLFAVRYLLASVIPKNAGGAQAVAKVFCSVFAFLADALFVIASAVALILIAYACNSGRMRWMLVLGLAAGFFACRVTVGRLIRIVLRAIVGALLKLARCAIKFLLLPCRILKKCILSKKRAKLKED